MKLEKQSQAGHRAELAPEDLALINQMARTQLTQEEVYTFSVRLCDNEVDRDFDRFAPQTLEELAKLFVGKSGIFDHQWSARGQAARIYKTQVVEQLETPTRAGDGYRWLKGYAYMLRTDSNRDLITEIEGGIKKEVSVGCAVERSVCSICAADRNQGDCGHKKGEQYQGKLCFASLEGASDAYEFSFVAVPAQPRAGVVKGAGMDCASLKQLAQASPDCAKQLQEMEEQAKLGRQYLAGLRREVVRLGLLANESLERETLEGVAAKLSQGELMAMKQAYEAQAAKRYPLKVQLHYGEKAATPSNGDGAFLI